MNKEEKRIAAEQLARNRTVKGWAFRLGGSTKPEDVAEMAEIEAFLDGGPCPDRYRETYRLERERLKLEGSDD